MSVKSTLSAALGLVLSTALSGTAFAQEKITISYQPAMYWALPLHFANEKGWWSEVGLAPEFVTFPAGAPQIAAGSSGSWDVGITGAVPAVLGAARFNISTIAVANDESQTNALVVAGPDADAILADPALIKGQQILLTTNSTVDFTARKCLGKFGLAFDDVRFVNLGQAQIITAMSSDSGSLAGVWAPNLYTLEDKLGAKLLCSGADSGAVVPSFVIATEAYAEASPGQIGKFLAVYLRGWSWAKANPEEAKQLALEFYASGGLEVTPESMDKEFGLRPVFLLDEQLELMSRAAGASKVDGWAGEIGAFLATVGTITEAPDAEAHITDTYLQAIAGDEKLRAFAVEFDPK
ncbi:ABC transporter substrate-binding protein [Pseudogemmobacter faecipullorum]|uniref:ABC transporter substrate-binding protein n=1 Tax=Pseudogemmobacter faecipullorum TaxID=2755041 RepID=A0ABS8CM05_9RHOB|nr:ABC transporter substrate-binding protein [Pseudogemmobacter faecipullorum]MCB5410419.1 ABC transporter substrate-binding protein [Pseudogemmobacter faecipullorum]